MASLPGVTVMPGLPSMPGMMGSFPSMPAMGIPGMAGMSALPTPHALGSTAWPTPSMPSMAGVANGAAASGMHEDAMTEQIAIHEAVQATQHAQYMQQVQFLQQVRQQANQVDATNTRFKDDYRPLRLCRHFMIGECAQGERCIYAHCYEELHPASPDLPKDEETEIGALAEMKPVRKEEETAPNMRLRKKRDLCKKFMETGSCLRGKACPYAHGEHELGTMAFVLYDKVKLKICQHWAQGRCIYEDKCINAHGKQEIGQKRRDFFDMPPVKKRREDESIEDWRSSILRNPTQQSFPGIG
jgi:hypothetical protein